jgi:hypothetical protein
MLLPILESWNLKFKIPSKFDTNKILTIFGQDLLEWVWNVTFLTPKIPSVFLPISAVSDLLGGIHFSTKKKWELEEVTVGSWSYLVEHQPPKIIAPHSMGFRRL